MLLVNNNNNNNNNTKVGGNTLQRYTEKCLYSDKEVRLQPGNHNDGLLCL